MSIAIQDFCPPTTERAYILVDLGNLTGSGNLNSGSGNAINASGQVTGLTTLPGYGGQHAFRTSSIVAFINGIFTDLGTLGGAESYGFGINTAGQVVGYSRLSAGYNVLHAFRTSPTGTLTDGTATDLGTLGGADSFGFGINTLGQATGYSQMPDNRTCHAFRTSATGTLYDSGVDLGTLGGTSSIGRAINIEGQVTGYSDLPGDRVQHAFRTLPGGIVDRSGTDLETLGGSHSYGWAMNDNGQVVGWSQTQCDAEIHAFRTTATGRVNDRDTDLGTLGGKQSFGFGINNYGEVVGQSQLAGGTSHAFLYTDSHGLCDLNRLLSPEDKARWVLTHAYGINDRGQITGTGIIDNQAHAFILTPTSSINNFEPGMMR